MFGQNMEEQLCHVPRVGRGVFVCVPDAYQVLCSVSSFFCLCVACLSAFLHTQDDEGVPVELRNLPEYKELLELKRLKKQKLREIQEDKPSAQHVGYKVMPFYTISFCIPFTSVCMKGLLNNESRGLICILIEHFC